MPHCAQVVFDTRSKDVSGIAAESLAGKFQEPILWRGKDMLNGNTGIVNPILAAHEILRNQRTIHPGQHVIVHGVNLSERSSHFASPGQKTFWQRREGDVSLFQVHASFTKADEEITARIGINYCL